LLVLLALASALGVAVAIALAGVAMLLAAPAYADDGNLLLERPAGLAHARLLFAEAETQEDGPVVRTRVRQGFGNPFAEPLAGVYLLRLPDDAVLEELTFSVLPEDGERPDAPITARPAVLTLRKGPALVERTAQIGPGETLLVELEYRRRGVRRVLALSEAVR
jgi:hypothetical protein